MGAAARGAPVHRPSGGDGGSPPADAARTATPAPAARVARPGRRHLRGERLRPLRRAKPRSKSAWGWGPTPTEAVAVSPRRAGSGNQASGRSRPEDVSQTRRTATGARPKRRKPLYGGGRETRDHLRLVAPWIASRDVVGQFGARAKPTADDRLDSRQHLFGVERTQPTDGVKGSLPTFAYKDPTAPPRPPRRRRWLRRSETRPVRRSRSRPPEGRSFYRFLTQRH